MANIVLSGFGDFGAYKANSSQLVVEALHGKKIAGYKVFGKVLEADVIHDHTQVLLYYAKQVQAKGIISLGMASEKRGLCVESQAANERKGKYVPAQFQNSSITSDAYGHKVRMNLAPWNLPKFFLACQHNEVPCMPLSDDAGRFCCNFLMYLLQEGQRWLPPGSRFASLFMHTPCCPEAVVDMKDFAASGKTLMTIAQIIRGLELLLQGASL